MNRIEHAHSPAEVIAHGSPRIVGLLLGLGTATLTRLATRRPAGT